MKCSRKSYSKPAEWNRKWDVGVCLDRECMEFVITG